MNDESKRPAWMDDELVKDIPQEKMDFLRKMFQDGRGKNQKELMRLLIPMMQKAKQENLTFSPKEMNSAIAAIKKHSTEEELERIDKIIAKSKQ